MAHVIILIDNSFSMDSCMKNVVDGLNKFLEKIRYNHNTYMSVLTFNKHINSIVECQDVISIKEFDIKEFRTNGSTALFDAICETILKYSKLSLKNNLFIITDGDDNCSTSYTKNQTDEICNKAFESGNWKITHCHTDSSILNIPTIQYNVDDISNIFDNLKI
jgi:uncharacterized protein YegL